MHYHSLAFLALLGQLSKLKSTIGFGHSAPPHIRPSRRRGVLAPSIVPIDEATCSCPRVQRTGVVSAVVDVDEDSVDVGIRASVALVALAVVIACRTARMS